MSSLLKADFYRIFKDKMFLILCILSGGLAILISALYCLIDHSVVLAAQEYGEEAFHLFGASELFATMFGITGIVTIIIPIFTSIIIYRDFSSGVIRNKILAGKKRSEIYGAALIENIVLNVGFSVAVALISLIIGLVFLPLSCETNYVVSTVISNILFTLAMNICICIFTACMCCFFINGLRSLPLAIILPYVLLSVATSAMSIVMVVVMFEDPNNSHIVGKILELINFYGGRDALFSPLLGGGETLSVFGYEALMKGETYNVYEPLHMICYSLVPLGFGGLLSFLGIKVFKKKDLK